MIQFDELSNGLVQPPTSHEVVRRSNQHALETQRCEKSCGVGSISPFLMLDLSWFTDNTIGSSCFLMGPLITGHREKSNRWKPMPCQMLRDFRGKHQALPLQFSSDFRFGWLINGGCGIFTPCVLRCSYVFSRPELLLMAEILHQLIGSLPFQPSTVWRPLLTQHLLQIPWSPQDANMAVQNEGSKQKAKQINQYIPKV